MHGACVRLQVGAALPVCFAADSGHPQPLTNIDSFALAHFFNYPPHRSVALVAGPPRLTPSQILLDSAKPSSLSSTGSFAPIALKTLDMLSSKQCRPACASGRRAWAGVRHLTLVPHLAPQASPCAARHAVCSASTAQQASTSTTSSSSLPNLLPLDGELFKGASVLRGTDRLARFCARPINAPAHAGAAAPLPTHTRSPCIM